MSWWSKIFGGGEVVGGIVKAADKLHFSQQEKADADLQETNDARAFAAPGEGAGYFNDIVNAFNRIPRPFITAWLVGGFAGWWPLPEPDAIDPRWWMVFMIVLTFWFGGRMPVKDAPAMISAFLALRAKWKR